jgi:nucleotide-binding universal stress UspA family protein
MEDDPMTKRRVLIPLDGSGFSRQIMRVVQTFFAPEDVQLVLLRAAYPPATVSDVAPQDIFTSATSLIGSYDSYSRTLDAEYREANKERETYRIQLLQELRTEADRLARAGYAVTAEVVFGDPARRIIEYVAGGGIDLVAMATHGRSGIGRLVLGSVAERVLHGVAVPVLLMRSPEAAVRINTAGEELAQALAGERRLRMIIATDESTLAHEALESGCSLARTLDARLTVLVVGSERATSSYNQQIMQQVRGVTDVYGLRPEIVPLVGYADQVMLDYLTDHPTDLFFMGAFHDRSAGSATAIGTTAQRLVQYAPASVYVAKGHRPTIHRILACVARDDTIVVDVAAQLAKVNDARLAVLHVVPSAYQAIPAGGPSLRSVDATVTADQELAVVLRGWATRLAEAGIDQDVLQVEQGPAVEHILNAARDGNCDLIVVGSQSGPGQFLGSVASSVVRFSERSVLVVRTRSA